MKKTAILWIIGIILLSACKKQGNETITFHNLTNDSLMIECYGGTSFDMNPLQTKVIENGNHDTKIIGMTANVYKLVNNHTVKIQQITICFENNLFEKPLKTSEMVEYKNYQIATSYDPEFGWSWEVRTPDGAYLCDDDGDTTDTQEEAIADAKCAIDNL